MLADEQGNGKKALYWFILALAFTPSMQHYVLWAGKWRIAKIPQHPNSRDYKSRSSDGAFAFSQQAKHLRS
jgi:hypothetical protein